MRVLIVDENADFRLVLAETLHARQDELAQDAAARGAASPAPLELHHWDPLTAGVPGADSGFRMDFDVILIDSNIGPQDPVAWLAALKTGFQQLPPVVMLTSGRDADALAFKVLPLGVASCLARLQLTPARLFATLTEAVLEREQQRGIEYSLRSGIYPPKPRAAVPAAIKIADLPVIAGYQVERLIGEGGTARVYLARREADGLQLVLKVLLPELMAETPVVQRFMQEFSLIQKIQSVHVTRIFDLNYDRGVAYLAMEYFDAGDLRERIKAGFAPLPALKLFAQIARALDAIHDAGVVHRDLKPHNIMFRDQHHLAIVDFGGAKDIAEDSGLTKVGQVVGTPNYMSPEQILGRPLDARSDLYSLGVILHQLLTGRTLFQARDTAELMDMHVNAPVPQLPVHLAGFQKLLSRLVAKDPDQRFATARDLYAHIAA